MAAKSPLLRKLLKAYRKSLLNSKGIDGSNVYNEERRGFIKNMGIIGVGVAILPTLESCGLFSHSEETKPVVGIIGGGIAGLHAAYIFQKAGIPFKLFEASSRTGGRIFSKSGIVSDNTTTELGGEFIDSNHEDMINLSKEFGLKLLDCEQDATNNKLTKDAYFFGGKFISEEEVIKEFTKYVDRISEDQSKYENNDEKEVERLDNMSILDYIDQIGIKGWFKDLLNSAFTSEFGIEASEQSALNLLSMLSTETESGFKIFGDSDERYKIEGGNEKLIQKLHNSVKDNIFLEHELLLVKKKDTAYEVSFKNGKKEQFEYIILAIPFTTLRKVSFEPSLPEEKQKAINELGYGTNSKYFYGFKERKWREEGYAGYVFNDVIQNGWDNSVLQNNNKGEAGYTVFLGGTKGKEAAMAKSDEYKQMLNKIFQGLTDNGKTNVFNWSTSPFALASYSAYKKGQWTSISGNEAKPVDKIYFAGEHCSEDFQGYMNGGAETGRTAATTIIELVKNNSNQKK